MYKFKVQNSMFDVKKVILTVCDKIKTCFTFFIIHEKLKKTSFSPLK